MDKGCGTLIHRKPSSSHPEISEPLKNKGVKSKVKASDGLPLPLWFTNTLFCLIFIVSTTFLLQRWREKFRDSEELNILSWGEIVAAFFDLAAFIYLIGFCGVGYVQHSLDSNMSQGNWTGQSENKGKKIFRIGEESRIPSAPVELDGRPMAEHDDETLAAAVCSGQLAIHSLENTLDSCDRAVSVRRRAVELRSGQSLQGLPSDSYDYKAILGACCEMCIGYVPIPVGVAGPLLLDGSEYTVPMATTEGCLVASTNRGCKAITQSGGAVSVVLRDGMTRAPVVKFDSVVRAAELKQFLESPEGFEIISVEFNKMSRSGHEYSKILNKILTFALFLFQICQTPASEVCFSRKTTFYEVFLFYWGCYGNEYGLQRSPICPGLPQICLS